MFFSFFFFFFIQIGITDIRSWEGFTWKTLQLLHSPILLGPPHTPLVYLSKWTGCCCYGVQLQWGKLCFVYCNFPNMLLWMVILGRKQNWCICPNEHLCQGNEKWIWLYGIQGSAVIQFLRIYVIYILYIERIPT